MQHGGFIMQHGAESEHRLNHCVELTERSGAVYEPAGQHPSC